MPYCETMSNRHINISVDKLRRKPTQRPEGAKKIPADDRACPRCESHFREEEMVRNGRVCGACGHHFPITARERLDFMSGDGGWREFESELRAADPLQFVDLAPYTDRARQAEEATGLAEAVVTAELELDGQPAIIAVMDFGFMGGSMGSVVGEKIARAADVAVEKSLPFVVVCSSGGARMQEGVIALMQMAKTVGAFEEVNEASLPIVLVLTHPTTGGVWASFAALGDVTYAEPNALIAFSGPRVIEQTTREKLPPDFGRAETQLHNGQVDAVVDRRELADRIGRFLRILSRPQPEYGAAPVVQWAQDNADRAAKIAQALPTLSRRVIERVRKSTEGIGK
jgi:acetyl-CoA carboxylase carboxyl transferase subunit beta